MCPCAYRSLSSKLRSSNSSSEVLRRIFAVLDRDLGFRSWDLLKLLAQLGGQCPTRNCCLHSPHHPDLVSHPLYFELLLFLLPDGAFAHIATSISTKLCLCLSTTTVSGWLACLSFCMWKSNIQTDKI